MTLPRPPMQCKPKCALRVPGDPHTTILVSHEINAEMERKPLEMLFRIQQSSSTPVTQNNKTLGLYFVLVF